MKRVIIKLTCILCHSRESGNPDYMMIVDSCFHRNDNMHYVIVKETLI